MIALASFLRQILYQSMLLLLIQKIKSDFVDETFLNQNDNSFCQIQIPVETCVQINIGTS